MGFLSGGGNGFEAKPVKLLQGATVDQTNQAYGAGQGLTAQQQSTTDMLAGRAASANPIDYSGANASVGNANQVLAQLMATGQGQGPNPALDQLRQTTGQNIQQATGLVASQKGINPAMAARTAALAAASANQGAAGQAATLSAQQQLAAQQQAGGLATSIAGQQAGMAQAQAGQQAQNIGQLTQQQQAMGGMNLQEQQLLQQSLGNYNSQNVQQNLGINQINAQVAQQNAEQGSKMLGGILNAAGSVAGLAMMSDERVKSHVVRHEDEAIPGVPRATFEYKAEPGQKFEGVIAQDVERVRPDLVGQTAEGIKTVPVSLGPVPAGKRTDKEIASEAMGTLKARKQAKGGTVKGETKASDKEIAAQAMMHRLFGQVAPRLAQGGTAPDLGNVGLTSLTAPGLPSAAAAPPVDDPAPNGPGSALGRMWQSRSGGQQAAGLVGAALGGLGSGMTGGPNTAMQTIQTAANGYAQPYGRPYARGGEADGPFYSAGTPEVVPGRADVPTGTDSEAADKVPAWLSPGEGVLPRSVMQAPDAPEQARDFVAHLVATRRPRGRAKAAFGERSSR